MARVPPASPRPPPAPPRPAGGGPAPPPPPPEPPQCANGKHNGHAGTTGGNATGHVCSGSSDLRSHLSRLRHSHRGHGHARDRRDVAGHPEVHQVVEVRHRYLGTDVDRLATRLAEVLPVGARSPMARPVPRQLPAHGGRFVGREEEPGQSVEAEPLSRGAEPGRRFPPGVDPAVATASVFEVRSGSSWTASAATKSKLPSPAMIPKVPATLI